MYNTIFFIFIIILLIIVCYIQFNIFIKIGFSNINHTHHMNHMSHKSHINNELKKKAKEACSNNITDIEYLEHMIPHHQVAIDISRILQKKSKSDYMQHILRKLIYTQEHDIMIMKHMLIRLSSNVSDSKIKMNKKYIDTVANFTKPNKLGLTKVYCEPLFFDENKHMKHLDMMGLTKTLDEKSYLEHMIPHHQVAVDMSKNLLKNTTNDFMIYLCYRIIRNQEEEVVLLSDLLKLELPDSKIYKWKSNLLL
jgi:uncharacterized protein (DUF305 family)